MISERQAVVASALSRLIRGLREDGCTQRKTQFVAISKGELRITPIMFLRACEKYGIHSKNLNESTVIDMFTNYTKVNPRRGLVVSEFDSLCCDFVRQKQRQIKIERDNRTEFAITDPVEYIRKKLEAYMAENRLTRMDLFRMMDNAGTGAVYPQAFKTFIGSLKLKSSNLPGTVESFMDLAMFNQKLTEQQWLDVFGFFKSIDKSPVLIYEKFLKLMGYTRPVSMNEKRSGVSPGVRPGSAFPPRVVKIGTPTYGDKVPSMGAGRTPRQIEQESLDKHAEKLKTKPVEVPKKEEIEHKKPTVDMTPNIITLPETDEETSMRPTGVSLIPGKAEAYLGTPDKSYLPPGGFRDPNDVESLRGLFTLIQEKAYQRFSDMRRLFRWFNISGTGTLTFDELRSGIDRMNINISRETLVDLLRLSGAKVQETNAFSMGYDVFRAFITASPNSDELYSRVEPHRSGDIEGRRTSRHTGLDENMSSARVRALVKEDKVDTQQGPLASVRDKLASRQTELLVQTFKERLLQRSSQAAWLFNTFDEARIGSINLQIFIEVARRRYGVHFTDEEFARVYKRISPGDITFNDFVRFIQQ